MVLARWARPFGCPTGPIGSDDIAQTSGLPPELPTFLAAEDARLHGKRDQETLPIIEIGAYDGIESVNKIRAAVGP